MLDELAIVAVAGLHEGAQQGPTTTVLGPELRERCLH